MSRNNREIGQEKLGKLIKTLIKLLPLMIFILLVISIFTLIWGYPLVKTMKSKPQSTVRSYFSSDNSDVPTTSDGLIDFWANQRESK